MEEIYAIHAAVFIDLTISTQLLKQILLIYRQLGGSVDTSVSSSTKGPLFESKYRQIFWKQSFNIFVTQLHN